jgi:hypothetical protein
MMKRNPKAIIEAWTPKVTAAPDFATHYDDVSMKGYRLRNRNVPVSGNM